MRRPHAHLLCSGGLRSLVAAALVNHEEPAPRLTLLHAIDGRDNVTTRRRHVRLQAEWLEALDAEELLLPHLYPKDAPRTDDGEPIARLARPQLLLAASARAERAEAGRLIYPGNFGDNPEALAGATEQLQLIAHLALTEGTPGVPIEAPLLEMTDAQVVQLGESLGVPWHAAWSCRFKSEMPCGACPGCVRRRHAFEAAQVVDSQRAAVAGR